MRSPKYITFSQVTQLAQATSSMEENVMIMALGLTGCRISEILRIRPVDISVAERWISIPHLKRARKNSCVKAKQPGEAPGTPPEAPPEQLTRRIPLAAPLIPLFTALMEAQGKQPGQRQTAKRRMEASERPLFPFSRMTAFRIVREASMRSGIRTQDGRLVHPHALRHTFAIQWIKGGGKIEMLQRFLGHSDTKTTSIYLQFAPTDLMHEQDRIFTNTGV